MQPITIYLWTIVFGLTVGIIARLGWLVAHDFPGRTPGIEALNVFFNLLFLIWTLYILGVL